MMTRAASNSPQVSEARARSRPEAPRASASRPARLRTAKACRLCNAKRVKCDASERGTPCTRCEQRGEPNCTLIDSRRGIYTRKPRRQELRDRNTANGTHDAQADGSIDDTIGPSKPQSRDQHVPVPVPDTQQVRCSTAPASVQSRHATSPSATEPGTDARQHDPSWSAVFETLLDRHDRRKTVDKCSIAYVGESFALNIIDGSRGSTGRPLLHHMGPTTSSTAAQTSSQGRHPAGISPEEISYLEAKQAFTAPPDAVLDVLVAVFMERVFPLYPIINPEEFLQQQKAQKLPWILLHSVCFLAATFCPSRILYQAGFNDRKQARASFYTKAKALFDVGYESSKIITLQVAISLSFWGGSPNNHWNFYTWISNGVTVAETIGCHRSMAGINITPQDRGLLKRLWWTLVIRDAASASMHGRPFRINLDHCDVDELTMEDFEFEGIALPDQLPPNLFHLAGLYQIQAAKLALLLRQIVTMRFYPRSQEVNSPSILHELLLHWRNGIPEALQWTDSDGGGHKDVFRTTLRILYNHNIILTHIKPESMTDNENPLSPSTWLGEEVTSLSAQQIASLACSMVTASGEIVPPHELFHGLFMACIVFFVQSRSSNPMTASLGRSALTNCKMALHLHRDTWDASPWITQLFDKALSHPVAQSIEPLNANIDPQTFNNLDILDTNGLFLDGMEGWPNHLFLGDLFDPSTNTATFEPPILEYPHEFPAQMP